jgi:hypothetical protein
VSDEWVTADVKTCPHGYVFNGKCPVCAGWISVEDKSPESGENVLVFGLGIIRMAYMSGGWWRFSNMPFEESELSDSSVTHWMPLPEPPNE